MATRSPLAFGMLALAPAVLGCGRLSFDPSGGDDVGLPADARTDQAGADAGGPHVSPECASSPCVLSGVINDYAAVTTIDGDRLEVVDATGFAVGDRVVVIQMQGATLSLADDESFGSVLAASSAGNYELARLVAVGSNQLTIGHPLTRSYQTTGAVQLVRVVEASDVAVSGPLRAQPWNGATGGVLALFATGQIHLQADLSVRGAGFRGGNVSRNPDGSCGLGSPSFFYDVDQPGPTWDAGGAMKGEGIAVVDAAHLGGRGRLGNGGGGGNKHNHGGGGGGGYRNGGQGGEGLEGCAQDGTMGIGGLGLGELVDGNRLFLGGGGGCGDYNDGVGSNGANGGGIVILRAQRLSGDGHAIDASGDDETVVGTGIADGVGGGGGGGLIVLDVPDLVGPLLLRVSGGNGGDQDPSFGCVGTGGGGGGGVVLARDPSQIDGSMVVADAAPGRAGEFPPSSPTTCAGTTYFAAPGQDNPTPVLSAPTIAE